MKVDGKIIKKCYYIAMIAALAVFAVSIPLTHGNSMKVYLWKAGSSFYDFFYCIKKCDLLEPDGNLSDEKYLSAAGKCLLYDDYSLYVRGNPAENAKYGCQ